MPGIQGSSALGKQPLCSRASIQNHSWSCRSFLQPASRVPHPATCIPGRRGQKQGLSPRLPCIHLLLRVKALVAQSCSTLCNPMDCSLPGFSVRGDFPSKNTGVGSLSLLQGIFLTQGSNPGLPHCRRILYHLSHQGSLKSLLPVKISLVQPTREKKKNSRSSPLNFINCGFQQNCIYFIIHVNPTRGKEQTIF